jgi:hypothetical protein
MSGGNSSPLSSLSQSNGTFDRNLMDIANFSSELGTESIDGNSNSPLNETFTIQNASLTATDSEREKVQEELVNAIKKAYSLGAEIPELPSFYDDTDGTIFIKVNVINPIDKKANASDFTIRYDYEYGTSVGTGQAKSNDAGVFIKISPSNYAITAPFDETGDQVKDSFLKSFTTSYSKGCSGHLLSMEIKDCTITKKYADITNVNSTGPNGAY